MMALRRFKNPEAPVKVQIEDACPRDDESSRGKPAGTLLLLKKLAGIPKHQNKKIPQKKKTKKTKTKRVPKIRNVISLRTPSIKQKNKNNNNKHAYVCVCVCTCALIN